MVMTDPHDELDDLDALLDEVNALGTSSYTASKPSTGTFVPGGSSQLATNPNANSTFPVRLTPTAPEDGPNGHRPAFGTHRRVIQSPPGPGPQLMPLGVAGGIDTHGNVYGGAYSQGQVSGSGVDSANANNGWDDDGDWGATTSAQPSASPPPNSFGHPVSANSGQNSFGHPIEIVDSVPFQRMSSWDDDSPTAPASSRIPMLGTSTNAFLHGAKSANSHQNNVSVDSKPACANGIAPLLGVDTASSSGPFRCRRSDRIVACLKCDREVVHIAGFTWKDSVRFSMLRERFDVLAKFITSLVTF